MEDAQMTETQLKIIGHMYKAAEDLGAGMELLSLIGSFGDTQPDGEILHMFELYNNTGSYMTEVIIDVNDTPLDRRARMKLV